MPFRLTRQFVNLMLPLKESGTLQSVMVHTLRALRNNHELLLNTMDVFIKEPSLDWQVCCLFRAPDQLRHAASVQNQRKVLICIVQLKDNLSRQSLFRTHDLCNVGTVLYQLSYQANWELVILWSFTSYSFFLPQFQCMNFHILTFTTFFMKHLLNW